jgi:hypothetical protein
MVDLGDVQCARLAVEVLQLAAEHDIEPELEANHSGSCAEAA